MHTTEPIRRRPQIKSTKALDSGLKPLAAVLDAIGAEELKGPQVDAEKMQKLHKQLQEAGEAVTGDPRNNIFNRGRGPGSMHPMNRGVHHNPAGGEQGNIDWSRPPKSLEDGRRLERAGRALLRDYGPGGIARRFGQNEFVGYPLYIDQVAEAYPPLPPLNPLRDNDQETM